jgi:hypothetical protein
MYVQIRLEGLNKGETMEKSGEQCIVVFAWAVTELASGGRWV